MCRKCAESVQKNVQRSVPINTTHLLQYPQRNTRLKPPRNGTHACCACEGGLAFAHSTKWKIPRFRSTRCALPHALTTCLDYMPCLRACLHACLRACPHACRGLQRRHRVTPLVYVSLLQKRRQIADKSPTDRRSIDPPDRSLPRRSSRRLEEAGRGWKGSTQSCSDRTFPADPTALAPSP